VKPTRDTLRSVHIDAGADRVFDALATAAGLAGWWTTRVDRVPGDRPRLRLWWSETDHTTMRVDRLDPPRRIEWTCVDQWDRNLPDPREWVGTRILFDLRERDEGTEVTVRHAGLLALDCAEQCDLGWSRFLRESLKPFVEQGAGQPLRV